MADYVNTLDLMSPEEAEDAVVSGLTELVEMRLSRIETALFEDDKTIKKAVFPVATDFSSYVFRDSAIEELVLLAVGLGYGSISGCDKLRVLDICYGGSIGDAGSKLTALTTFVLRALAVVTLSNTKMLTDSPIANGTGYIYVPRSLVDDYQSATNWSTFAGQFRVLQDYTVDGTIDGELDRAKLGL